MATAKWEDALAELAQRRSCGTAELRKHLEWPVEGALFDVERNGLWCSAWGLRPPDPAAAIDLARSHLEQAPKLVPVRGHRYLPAGRGAFGHPVLSIVQTDIVFYGTDIADYITNEFDGGHISAAGRTASRIVESWWSTTTRPLDRTAHLPPTVLAQPWQRTRRLFEV
ncbi:hypothetical protein ACFQY7_11235 [Actinomadura luteofluorescens]|uniref:Uncharacterized protein n=1 Tax=Actinomadura luteofluorescens TaxID=46163 RepID=A0A7Y9ERW6_9ACTN|nr:hypothetical protein [Actinomadura luteofluorescens]NYD52815.1 hypothetical protein [Actinomadura luteofluorescens]